MGYQNKKILKIKLGKNTLVIHYLAYMEYKKIKSVINIRENVASQN